MVELAVDVSRSTVPADGTTVTAVVSITPGMRNADLDHHLALCVDTSGSMAGEKIEQVREAVLWVFGYLDDDDVISVVSFDDVANVVLPSTPRGDLSVDEAEALVERLRPGGGTDIRGGLEAAYETLRELPAGRAAARRILLLSDGRGDVPAETLAAFVGGIRADDGVAVSAAGVGDFYDEAVIRAVGTASDGEWVHLSRPADIEEFFGRNVEQLQTVVAPKPSLRLDLADGAELRHAYLRRPQVRELTTDRHEGAIQVSLPDLVEFEPQELVLAIRTPTVDHGGDLTLADVTLDTGSATARASIVVTCTDPVADAETRVGSSTPTVGVDAAETRIESESEADVESAETRIESGSESRTDGVDAAETRVQPPDSESDVEVAETRIESGQSDTDTDTDVNEAETRIESRSEADVDTDTDVNEAETRIESRRSDANADTDVNEAETRIESRSEADDEVEAAETRIGLAGATEPAATDPVVTDPDAENETVALTYLDTLVRQAVGEGDIERAETIVDRAGHVHDDVDLASMKTVVQRARDGGLEERYLTTRIQRDE